MPASKTFTEFLTKKFTRKIIIRTSDDNLLDSLIKFSWILLGILTFAGSIVSSTRMGLSILAGGILALGNYYWLRNIMERILFQKRQDARQYALIRYLLRLLILAIFVLIFIRYGAEIIGLFIGLSVLVITTFFISLYSLTRHKGD